MPRRAAILLFLLSSALVRAESPGLDFLKTQSFPQLESLFLAGSSRKLPSGEAKGFPLLFSASDELQHLAQLFWRGKVFAGLGSDRLPAKIYRGYLNQELDLPTGEKINGVAGDQSVLADGRESILLNYDLPENPAVVRRIIDEIRGVLTDRFAGLYLGRATVDGDFWLYFALQSGH